MAIYYATLQFTLYANKKKNVCVLSCGQPSLGAPFPLGTLPGGCIVFVSAN